MTTSFFVDPDFAGSTRDGSASNPWQSLVDFQTNVPWDAINAQLSTDPVDVYFAARKAASDIQHVATAGVLMKRTSGSVHRLTVDGKSRYNTNVGSPSWADYVGLNTFKVALASGSVALGDNSSPGGTFYTQHYLTMRGFEVTGVGARVRWKGSHTIVEDIYSHDVTGTDPCFLFGAATDVNCNDYGRDTDITIRRIRCINGMGESIYINGNYQRVEDGGCPSYGNTHSNILIEDFWIENSGINGAQGDGIDLKAGLQNVIIRRGTIKNTTSSGEKGIVSNGIFSPASNSSNFLIENVNLFNTPGIVLSYVNGAVIRNCVLANSAAYGRLTGISTSTNGDGVFNYNVEAYHNTLLRGAIGFIDTQTLVRLRNNLISRLSVSDEQLGQHGTFSGLDSDYNCLINGGATGNWSEGGHSVYLSGSADLFLDEENFNLRLKPGVAPIGAGVALSPAFPDPDGVTRPGVSGWDMGAYQSSPASKHKGKRHSFTPLRIRQ